MTVAAARRNGTAGGTGPVEVQSHPQGQNQIKSKSQPKAQRPTPTQHHKTAQNPKASHKPNTTKPDRFQKQDKNPKPAKMQKAASFRLDIQETKRTMQGRRHKHHNTNHAHCVTLRGNITKRARTHTNNKTTGRKPKVTTLTFAKPMRAAQPRGGGGVRVGFFSGWV